MIRFAIAVTGVEVALTLAASLWIAFAETSEPYLTEGEFAQLGILIEKYSTDRRTRFGATFSYDTQAVVKGPGPALTVSVRINTPRAEYDSRLAGERRPKLKDGDEPPSVADEPWRQELGYAVRQRGRNGVRAEGVRLRGSEMLIVRAIWMTGRDMNPGYQAATCDKLVRILQDHMMKKLAWREEPPSLTFP